MKDLKKETGELKNFLGCGTGIFSQNHTPGSGLCP